MTGGNHQGGNRAAREILDKDIPTRTGTFKTADVLKPLKRNAACRHFNNRRLSALIREREDIIRTPGGWMRVVEARGVKV